MLHPPTKQSVSCLSICLKMILDKLASPWFVFAHTGIPCYNRTWLQTDSSRFEQIPVLFSCFASEKSLSGSEGFCIMEIFMPRLLLWELRFPISTMVCFCRHLANRYTLLKCIVRLTQG